MGTRAVRPKKGEVRRQRILRGWTQEDLAHRAKRDKKTIENAEAGKPVSVTTIAEIADAFGGGVTVASLIESDPAEGDSASPLPRAVGNAPPAPRLLVGRQDVLRELHRRLSRAATADHGPTQVLTAVRGWPGVGKTTVARALAHSDDVKSTFPDGVLWASLGPTPSVEGVLRSWARALAHAGAAAAETTIELSHSLAGCLRDRRMLLIIDDVWDAKDANLLLIGGRRCGMLVTTRLTAVAEALASSPDDRYRLDVLDERQSLELLRSLAPEVLAAEPDACRQLVRDLEGLPLALQVAGRLLHAERRNGFDVRQLLSELRADAAKLLASPAPADVADESTVPPTVTALFRKSTDRLDPLTRKRFAYLAPFAPKPATFEVADLAAVWKAPEPDVRETVAALVDRGLMEPTGEGDYQVHQLLVQHAKSLLPKRQRGRP